jgi:DNA replication protein DnaC
VCGQERADYPTYLLRLAERELFDRERRATERRIKEAAIPVLKTIETIAFAAQPPSSNRWCGNSCAAI